MDQSDKSKVTERRSPGDLIEWRRMGIPATVDAQIERMKAETIPQSVDFLRKALLSNVGIRRPKKKSENVVQLSCLCVFGMTMQLRSMLKLLDRIGFDYTFLPDREYCCGWGTMEEHHGEARARAREGSKELIGMNMDMARELGAKRMYHFCQWCAFSALHAYPEGSSDITHHYHLDAVAEVLSERDIPFRSNKKVAYYGGCQIRAKALTPGAELNWQVYRPLLDHVKGAEIVEMPHRVCCVPEPNADRIIEQAKQAGADVLVTPCAACWTWLDRKGRRVGLPVQMTAEFLLDSLADGQ